MGSSSQYLPHSFLTPRVRIMPSASSAMKIGDSVSARRHTVADTKFAEELDPQKVLVKAKNCFLKMIRKRSQSICVTSLVKWQPAPKGYGSRRQMVKVQK